MKRYRASVVLAVLAAALWLGFGLVHVLGWRESVPVLSLTFPAHQSFAQAAVQMSGYVLGYLGATLVAPVLLLAALLRAAVERVRPA